MRFAENLRNIRKMQKITQAQLAELSGVSQSAISDIEGERRNTITVDTLIRLARVLGVHPTILYGTGFPDARTPEPFEIDN